ncbi:MAG: M23 family metallopeptidase [Candidatus Obscuribacterales bacterium]|jgi:hypothetical protein
MNARSKKCIQLLATIGFLSTNSLLGWNIPNNLTYAQSRQAPDLGCGQTDQGLQIVKIVWPNEIRIYGFSSKFLEVSIRLTCSGENCTVSPSQRRWRGLSKNNNDPLVTIKPINLKLPVSYHPIYEVHIGATGGTPNQKYQYALPFLPNAEYKVMQGYRGPTHKVGQIHEFAVDFALPENTVICAARNGTVIGFRDDSMIGGPEDKYNMCANYVYIKHDDGSYAEYAHLQRNGALVKLGSRVERGQIIALSGNTGQSSGPHLHFSVFYYDKLHLRHSVPLIFTTAKGLITSPKPGQLISHPKISKSN